MLMEVTNNVLDRIEREVMNTIVIVLGIFFTLSIIASVVVVAVCALSSQISQEEELVEQGAVYSVERRIVEDNEYLKESIPA